MNETKPDAAFPSCTAGACLNRIFHAKDITQVVRNPKDPTANVVFQIELGSSPTSITGLRSILSGGKTGLLLATTQPS
jgi:hypothetical protein